MKVLLLRHEEVTPLFDMERAIDVTEAAFREHGEGKVVAQAPVMVRFPQGRLRVKSGALLGSGSAGVQLVGMGETGIAVLYDIATGDLQTIMAAGFANLRTGATIGVGAKYLTREDTAVVGLIGTGQNALSILEGVSFVRPVREAFVYSRNAERRNAFAQKASKVLNYPVHAVEEPAEAIKDMDVVLTSTDSRRASVVPGDCVGKGMTILSMGVPGELGKELYLKADRIVSGCKEHEQNYFDTKNPQPLMELIDEGKLRWDDVPDLGDVVVGKAAGRSDSEELIIFKEAQGGWGDVAFAQYAYQQAVAKGLGQEVEL